jgi:uncharacterized membrane protein
MDILQAFVIIVSPAVFLWLEKKISLFKVLGAVIICYAFGLLMGNLPFLKLNPNVSKEILSAAVPLSIPLMLFSTDFIKWLRLAKATVVSFILMLVVVTIMAISGAYIFKDIVPEYWKVAGMLVGVFTGGTPNMSAIGMAVDVKEEVFILLNTSDLILGGSYFFFAIAFVHKILAKFLRPFESDKTQPECTIELAPEDFTPKKVMRYLGILLFSGAILGLSAGFSMLLFKKLAAGFIILLITTIGIACSFSSKIRSWEFSYDIGQYLLLVFCVGIGSMADLSQLANSSLSYIAFTGFVMYGSLLSHFFLCWVFKIDRDTSMITSIAGIFGPAFIGPIASALGNREIVVSGLTSSLVGIALGNYLGIILSNFLAP